MNEVDRNAKIIWEYMLIHHELKPADAILALGTNDLKVPERAAELYFEKYAPHIICSGGIGRLTTFPKPEAEVFADILLAKGVSADVIIVENKSTNTGENILFTKRLLEEKALDFSSFIVVHSPYSERRTFATFRKQFPEATCLITSPQVPYEDYANDDAAKEHLINVMVGDLQRIREYPNRGFQIPQEIPKQVLDAYEILVGMGYDRFVLRD